MTQSYSLWIHNATQSGWAVAYTSTLVNPSGIWAGGPFITPPPQIGCPIFGAASSRPRWAIRAKARTFIPPTVLSKIPLRTPHPGNPVHREFPPSDEAAGREAKPKKRHPLTTLATLFTANKPSKHHRNTPLFRKSPTKNHVKKNAPKTTASRPSETPEPAPQSQSQTLAAQAHA